MKTFIVNWEYYSMAGIESGSITLRAKTESEAEQKFYKNNNDCFSPFEGKFTGFVVNSIIEA